MWYSLKITSFILILSLIGCDRQATPNVSAAQEQFTTYTVTAKPLHQSVEQVAVGMPLTINHITAPIEGYIAKQLITYGSSVKKGDIIFNIVDEDANDKIFAALSEYLSAEIDLHNAENEYNDNALEYEAGLVSRETYNTKKMDLVKNKTHFLEAKYKLAIICKAYNLDLEKVQKIEQEKFITFMESGGFSHHIAVRADNDGTLIPLALNPDKGMTSAAISGTKVEAGQAIAAIGDLHQAVMTIHLSESQLSMVNDKQPITVIAIAHPKQTLTASVAQINLFEFDPKADEQTRYPVTIHVKSDELIKPGTRFRITIQSHDRKSLLVPINAIYNLYDKPYVIMADKHKRFVTLGQTTRTDAEVTSGLKENERILLPTKQQVS